MSGLRTSGRTSAHVYINSTHDFDYVNTGTYSQPIAVNLPFRVLQRYNNIYLR